MKSYEPFLLSVLYYAIVFIFCELSRQLANLVFGNSPFKKYVYEFIAVLQVCTCVYENHLIVKNYGVTGFFLVVFNLLNFHRLVNRGAIVSPSNSLERVVDGKLSSRVAIGLLIAQLLGALMAFRFARQIWWMEFTADHAFQSQKFECIMAYKVPMWTVALFEFFGAFLIRLFIGRVSKRRPEVSPYAMAFAVASGLSFGITFIGAPGLNPTIAFARTFGCQGISPAEFFGIYWLASISGTMAAYFLERSQRSIAAAKKHN